MPGKPDDLEAVRKVADALEGFPAPDQERILRWVRERVGLGGSDAHSPAPSASPPPAVAAPATPGTTPRNLRAFVAAKAPATDIHFATAVAYYYRFEAPESERKEGVNADDLQEACRTAGRSRLQNPGQTLRNAHRDGLLDRSDRGTFSINAVGENLVAMTLPSGAGNAPARPAAKRKKAGKGKKPAKRR